MCVKKFAVDNGFNGWVLNILAGYKMKLKTKPVKVIATVKMNFKV